MITTTHADSDPMALEGLTTKEVFAIGEADLVTVTKAISNISSCAGGCGCDDCTTHLEVFAEVVTTNALYNDITTFWNYSKLTAVSPNNTLKWWIQKDDVDLIEITDNTYGAYTANGGHSTQLNLSTVELNWQTVLNTHGVGCYRIRWGIYDLAGTTLQSETFSQKYHLSVFYAPHVEGTVLFEWTQNGNILSDIKNLTGINLTQRLRIKGIIGFNSPTLEIDEIEKSDHTFLQIKDQVINEYTFQSELLPEWVTDVILKDMVMSNTLKVTDFNFFNHHTITEKEVRLSGIEDTRYPEFNSCAILELKFKERKDNIIKRNNF